MRIVVTAHHFPPRYVAGVELYTLGLARWLVEHGHETRVVCVESVATSGDEKVSCRHEIYEGIPVSRLCVNLGGRGERFRFSYQHPAVGEWFGAMLAQERPDLVHVNSCYMLSASTFAAAKRASLPVVLTLHDFWFLCPRITLLRPTGEICRVPDDPAECAWCVATERRRYRWIHEISAGAAAAAARPLLHSSAAARALGIQPDASEIRRRRQVLKKALDDIDCIIATTEFARQLFIENGVPPSNIILSRLGIDPRRWTASPETPMRSNTDVHFAYIGQLNTHKGTHLLVEAFNRLRFEGSRAHLKIYGDLNAFPDYVASLRKRMKGNPLVELAGPFVNHRIGEILQQTDVVVVPSLFQENPSLVIEEALTSGTPVIAANVGAIPEIVRHNVNGILFERGNVAALTQCLQRVIDEPELLGALAREARPVRLLDDEMVQLLSLYERVAQVGGAPRGALGERPRPS